MNVQRLSNNELIEKLTVYVDADIQYTMPHDLLMEVMLRLAKNDERDRMLAHAVPEFLLCSFVEAGNPNVKMLLGDVFNIIVRALDSIDESLAQGNVDGIIEKAKMINKARIKGAEDAKRKVH